MVFQTNVPKPQTGYLRKKQPDCCLLQLLLQSGGKAAGLLVDGSI